MGVLSRRLDAVHEEPVSPFRGTKCHVGNENELDARGAQEALRTNGGEVSAPGVRRPPLRCGTGYFTVTVIGFDDVAPAALANSAMYTYVPGARPAIAVCARCAFGEAAVSDCSSISTPFS